MLSPKTQTNLTNAKSYFREHLAVGDYYCESERVAGQWIGNGVEALGLSGSVSQADFLALCENKHPQTGERLTQRHKQKRNDAGHEVANRRVFFDFTFSPPKSVSIAALVAEDARIVDAHRVAVESAVRELEQFAGTRVRQAGVNQDRSTRNIVAALFEHETSRALDPHLHTHCIVFNATHDGEEERWKALQNYEMLAAQKYVENVYYHELAQRVQAMGYTVENSARGDFQIAEVPSAIRERFSKRHREIDEQTRRFLAEHPAKRSGNRKDLREHLAHKLRSRKLKEVPKSQLRALWRSQLAENESDVLDAPKKRTVRKGMSAAEAVSWAEDHLFERRSVVYEHELWRHALEVARGGAVGLAAIKNETSRRPYIREESARLTREDVLFRESAIVRMTKDGIGTHAPLAPNSLRQNSDLAPDQSAAYEQILGSRDFVTLFRGGAGTGKSFVLRRVQTALERAGHSTIVAAPQRQQVIDLERDGLLHTRTVAQLLAEREIPPRAVIIVDEAGQIGANQLHQLLEYAKLAEARVILSGDTRQHGPVEASDALRAIERYAGVQSAALDEIRRQDPNRGKDESEQATIRTYREAVKQAAEGAIEASFDRLDRLGAIAECAPEKLREQVAQACVDFAERDESSIVVSQTWAEIHQLNDAIREAYKRRGLVDGNDVCVTSLEAVDLTAAQKQNRRFIPDEHLIVFNRKVGHFASGTLGKVHSVTDRGLIVECGQTVQLVKPAQLDAVMVCRPKSLLLAKGDRLQIKTNTKSLCGARVANGEIVTVSEIQKSGAIKLSDGRQLSATFRQFVRGYAVTSYGSQGKTVDHVLLCDSAVKGATNAQQWYVSISRGRKSVRIFTPNKAELRQQIVRCGDRALGLDLDRPLPTRKGVRRLVERGLHRGRAFAKAVCKRLGRRKSLAAEFQSAST